MRRPLRCGGGASGILVSSTARDAGIARPRIPALDPGHGRRLRPDERRRLWPRGQGHPGRVRAWCCARASARRWPLDDARLHLSPQRAARRRDRRRARLFAGSPASPRRSRPRWTGSPPSARRSQPLRSRTGGSTFKNPPGTKAWKLIDAAGCRGLAHRRRAGLGEALQLPAQPRRGDVRRHRGAGRGGAAAGAARTAASSWNGKSSGWEWQRG